MTAVARLGSARRLVLAPAAAALVFLAACARPASDGGPAPGRGEWRSFEGTWTAAGDRHALDVGPDAQAIVMDLSGSIVLVGERGLGAGFQSRALTFSDGAGTNAGRAVWTDERGDRIFSALRGAAVARGRRILGTITGGTGRWSGIEGEYSFDWQYVVESEGRVQGRAVGLRGRARIVAPEGGAR